MKTYLLAIVLLFCSFESQAQEETQLIERPFFVRVNWGNAIAASSRSDFYTRKMMYVPEFSVRVGLKHGVKKTKFRLALGYEYNYGDYMVEFYTPGLIDIHGPYQPNRFAIIKGNNHFGTIQLGLEKGKKHKFIWDVTFGFGSAQAYKRQMNEFMSADTVAFSYQYYYDNSTGDHIYALRYEQERVQAFSFKWNMSIGYALMLNSNLFLEVSADIAVIANFERKGYSDFGYSYALFGLNLALGYQFGKAKEKYPPNFKSLKD